MTSYTPTAHQGHNEDGHHHNIYIRRGSGDVEFGVPISSFRRTEHTLMNTFRERLNLRTCCESSLNTSTCDNEMLDEDLGHPPATHDTPPGAHMGSLQSDSLLSSAFRSRSRSDAANAPLFCRQNVGTIVLFPNRLEKQSKRHNLRVRAERHSVCVTDLPELKNCGSPMPSNHLFVDAKLANAAIASAHCHRPPTAVEMRSSMWNLPCQFSPLQLEVDRNDTFERHQSSPIYTDQEHGIFNTNTLQTARRVGSEPTSPFSNYAILIKEEWFSTSLSDLSVDTVFRNLIYSPFAIARTSSEYFCSMIALLH
ncbi:unnamed protein product [Cercopithifilaria johnstoni]|uniref:Uncharacterized protein n=1 Tax=Cercopithifilaria johnstoni TaxID=2874296 RepID=A0A8J2MTU2_9BILA|nr:unnamed protein product [Cercopithifilaria johnstoni]